MIFVNPKRMGIMSPELSNDIRGPDEMLAMAPETPNWCFHCSKKKKPTEDGLCPTCRRPMERVELGSVANREGRISIAILVLVTVIAFCYERTHDSSELPTQISTLILLVGASLSFGILGMCSFPNPCRELIVRTVPLGQLSIYESRRFSLLRLPGEMIRMLGVGLLGDIIIVITISALFLLRVLGYYLIRGLLDLMTATL
jgi:hypothetical protein